jgi:hypothetical protein
MSVGTNWLPIFWRDTPSPPYDFYGHLIVWSVMRLQGCDHKEEQEKGEVARAVAAASPRL